MTEIAPCLMFVGEQCGRAREAMELYVSVLPDSYIDQVQWDDDGRVVHARFVLAGRELAAMDSAGPHEFGFTPAMSLFADFDDLAAYERARDAFAEDGTFLMPDQAYPFAARFCWLDDRYGVSWQLRLFSNERA